MYQQFSSVCQRLANEMASGWSHTTRRRLDNRGSFPTRAVDQSSQSVAMTISMKFGSMFLSDTGYFCCLYVGDLPIRRPDLVTGDVCMRDIECGEARAQCWLRLGASPVALHFATVQCATHSHEPVPGSCRRRVQLGALGLVPWS